MLRPLKPIVDPAVEAAFEAFPADLRSGLLQLREMIIETAEKTEHVGPLLETTKWGQPAYLPSRPRVGSTVRIGTLKNAADHYAMFFHCQTTLVEGFQTQYPDEFIFQGNRALVFSKGRPLAAEALRHCIAQTLTHHLALPRTKTRR